MEIQPGNERESIGIEAAVGPGLADLERVAAAVARGFHGHMARLDQGGVIQPHRDRVLLRDSRLRRHAQQRRQHRDANSLQRFDRIAHVAPLVTGSDLRGTVDQP